MTQSLPAHVDSHSRAQRAVFSVAALATGAFLVFGALAPAEWTPWRVAGLGIPLA